MLTDHNFMNVACELGKASKCVSKNVAALIVKEGRIISTGYNGTPAGYTNCDMHWDGEYTEHHHVWSSMYEIHAEMNAILYAAKTGVNIDGATIYCTLEPCSECSKNLIQSGIKKIVYLTPYEYTDTEKTNKFLADCNIEKIKLQPL